MKRIAAEYVYTLTGEGVIRNGFVEYDEAGKILRIGKCAEDEQAHIFKGALVPGFVNAHCHLELSHLKGKFKKGTGMAGFIDQINALRDSSTYEDKLNAIGRELNGLWNQGVSAMADISNGPDTFPFKAATPMYTRSFLEVFGSEPEDCEGVMTYVRDLQKKAHAYGLDAAPTPHSPYTMSPQLVTASAAAGLEDGYLSYHSQESPEEEEMLMYGTGKMADNRRRAGMSMPPVTGRPALMYFLDRLAAIAPEEKEKLCDKDGKFLPHLLLVHNVCLSEEAAEAALKVLKNVWFAICPLSNIFIHDALPPIPLMRKMGLNIALGTDSLSSNDLLDMVSEMKCLQDHFPEVPMEEMLRWACLNGATFLSKEEELGSLAPGKKPGLVLIHHLDEAGRLTDESASVRII